jgi:uncharacterized protein YjiS (DUF1127 family)
MATLVHQPLTIFHRGPVPTGSGFWARLGRIAASWSRRRHARETFAAMTERDLGDAGIARWEIERELARSFWYD